MTLSALRWVLSWYPRGFKLSWKCQMETISTCSRTSESCLPSPYSLWPARARPHLAVEQKPTPWRKRPAVGFRLKWFSACDFSVVSGIAFTSSEWQLKVRATMCEFNSMQRQVSNSCQFVKLFFVASMVFLRANAASSSWPSWSMILLSLHEMGMRCTRRQSWLYPEGVTITTVDRTSTLSLDHRTPGINVNMYRNNIIISIYIQISHIISSSYFQTNPKGNTKPYKHFQNIMVLKTLHLPSTLPLENL